MLSKALTLGGLQVGGPRTQQNTARFRVADNVYQTLDGYMVPRFHNGTKTNITTTDATVTALVSGTKYRDNDFVLGINASNQYVPFYKGVKVPSTPLAPTFTYAGQLPGDGPQYTEKVGCLFAHFPKKGLFKYDQYQMYRAGVPSPWVYNFSNDEIGGTVYFRFMLHYRDMQGNVVHSNYVQHPKKLKLNGSGQIQFILNGANARGPKEDFVDFTPEDVASLSNGYMAYYYQAISKTVSGRTVILNTFGNHNVVPGIYLWCGDGFENSFFRNSSGLKTVGGKSLSGCSWAFKVLSSAATTVTISLDDVKVIYPDETEGFENVNGSTVSSDVMGCNYFVSFWTSDLETGAYFLKGMRFNPYEMAPNFYGTITPGTINAPEAGIENNQTIQRLNIAPIMGDFYDVTSKKSPFPWSLTYKELSNPKSFTVYSELAVIGYESVAYFSDTTEGGAFEMTNYLAYIAVGSEEDGYVQSVCGNADFLLVSRKFKNYYVSGNLPSAGYRAQSIPKTSLGCYSNEGSISVEDKVIFINKHGIWAIYVGGRCEEVSVNINGLFDNYANTTVYAEENYFNLNSYPSTAQETLDDKWIRVRYDLQRKLLAFAIVGDGTGKALILGMNSGEFYTWSGITAIFGTSPKFKDLFFIDGSYYATRNDASLIALNKEDKTSLAYMGSAYTPVLKTTWFTGGEPSLEKKINQVKMWGQVAGSISICHSVDWQEAKSKIADYTNAVSGQFSHKKRLEPANALSCSVEMVLNTSKFELEGLELEFQPFQEGMKR